MTDLQLALLGLGILIIVAIVLFNWWQERRLRTNITERLDEPRQDALMDDFHFDSEAVLKNDPAPTVVEPAVGPTNKAMPDGEIVNDSVNEVNLAVQEFEHDLAEPYQETAPEVTQEENRPTEAAEEVATTDELAEEAGLDRVAASDADFNLAAFDSAGAGDTKLPESVNQQIDLIALIYLPKPATGTALREFLLLLTDLDKPTHAHGLDSDDVWHLLTREQESVKFTRAAFSLQLADRSGVVSQPSLSRFQNAADSIAIKLGAQVEWQGSGDPWLFANELDEFCVEVDKMIGFHLVQGDSGPFTGTKFRGLAEASGLVLNEDGGFRFESEPESGGAQKLFSVVNQDSNPFSTEMLRTSVIHGISFQLDIPRVKNCAEVFNQMVLIARQMEISLGAHLVDDKGRPLGEPQIEKIREQLKVIHARMIARGVVPGSDSALRLFS
jgi:FtsZ-interacting cell division protein ZipA